MDFAKVSNHPLPKALGNMFKRNVEYQGMDCLDESNPMFMQYHTMLQNEVPWGDQPKYAKYTVYFGIVFIFIGLLKQIYYRFRDYTYKSRSDSNAAYSFIDVLVSYCRYVGTNKLHDIYNTSPHFLNLLVQVCFLCCLLYIWHVIALYLITGTAVVLGLDLHLWP